MMTDVPESPYRVARRAFIAACDASGVDAIARVQPGTAPDGKPLFMDAAALGPRDGLRAVMVIANDVAGSEILTGLLRAGVSPPAGMRLVLVHAPDPAAFLGLPGDKNWARAMLGAVATEDLSKVMQLWVFAHVEDELLGSLAAHMPRTEIRIAGLPSDFAAVRNAVLAAFASRQPQ
jgi:hypothetical protein